MGKKTGQNDFTNSSDPLSPARDRTKLISQIQAKLENLESQLLETTAFIATAHGVAIGTAALGSCGIVTAPAALTFSGVATVFALIAWEAHGELMNEYNNELAKLNPTKQHKLEVFERALSAPVTKTSSNTFWNPTFKIRVPCSLVGL